MIIVEWGSLGMLSPERVQCTWMTEGVKVSSAVGRKVENDVGRE